MPTLVTCFTLGVALVLTVGLQAPAVSVGLRWTSQPRARTLDLIPLEFDGIIVASGRTGGDTTWVRWVAWTVAVVALVVLLWALVNILRQRARPIRSITPVPIGADAGVAGEADARILTTGLVAAIEILATERDPSNAVVRAWQELEVAAAAAGLPRRAAETASEYTARILYRSRRSAEPIAVLLSLYQRVRFGEHLPSAAEIALATTSLTALTELWRSDLPERRPPRDTR